MRESELKADEMKIEEKMTRRQGMKAKWLFASDQRRATKDREGRAGQGSEMASTLVVRTARAARRRGVRVNAPPD